MSDPGVQVTFGANISGLVDGLERATSVVREGASKMEGQLAALTKSFEATNAQFGGLQKTVDAMKGSFAQAATAVRASAVQMEGSLAGARTRASALGAPFLALPGIVGAGFGGATAAMRQGTSAMQGLFGGLVQTIESVKAPFLALAGVVTGGVLFGAAAKHTVDWTMEVRGLAIQLGTTTEKASVLAVALNDSGVSTERYRQAAMRLQMALRTNESLLNANKVATRDASGVHLGMDEVMQNTIRRMSEMREGYDRNQLALLAFGRSAAGLQDLMRLNGETMSDAERKVRQLGLAVTSDGVSAVLAYKKAIGDVNEVFSALKFRIGNEILPRLTELGLWFAEEGPRFIKPMATAMTTLADILMSTGFKIAAFALFTKAALIPAFAAAGSAVMAFVGRLQVQLALGAMEGVTGISRLTGALSTMINPWLAAAVAIGAAVYALERWNSRNERAAEAALKNGRALEANGREFDELAKRLTDVDAVMRSSTASAAEKATAEEQMKATIEGLLAISPAFQEALVYESNGHLNVAETLKRANEQRRETMRLQAEDMDQKRRALEEERARLEKIAALAKDAGRNPNRNFFDLVGVSADRAVEKVKELNELISKLRRQSADVKLSLSGSPVQAPGAGAGEGDSYTTAGEDYEREMQALRHKYAREEVRIEDEAQRAKAAARKRYGAQAADMEALIDRNATEAKHRVREAREQAHQDVMRRYALTGAQERARIEAELAAEIARYQVQIEQARRTGNTADVRRLEEERDAAAAAGEWRLGAYDSQREVQDLRAQLDFVRNNNDLRLAMEREIVDKITKLHGEASEEAKRARENYLKVERAVTEEDERLQLQIADARRARRLTDLDSEARDLARRRQMGEMTTREELSALADLENEKFAIRLEGLREEQKLSGLSLEQKQALYDQELALFKEHNEKLKGLAADSEIQARQTVDKYISPLSSAFENEAADGFQRGMRGIEDAWGAAIRRMAAQAMAAQLHKLLLGGAWGLVRGFLGSPISGTGAGGELGTGVPVGATDYNGTQGYMAEGGRVKRGESWVVGEKGIEVFTASADGRIVPNDEIGAALKGAGEDVAPRWQVPGDLLAQAQRGAAPRAPAGGSSGGRAGKAQTPPAPIPLVIDERYARMTMQEFVDGYLASAASMRRGG